MSKNKTWFDSVAGMENGHKICCVMWCASVPFFLYPREMGRTGRGEPRKLWMFVPLVGTLNSIHNHGA